MPTGTGDPGDPPVCRLEQAIQVIPQMEGAASLDLYRLVHAKTVEKGLAEERYVRLFKGRQPAVDNYVFGYGSE
jgi:hypothetical protein